MEEAADVVVLVERGEELCGFFRGQRKTFEGDGFAALFGERRVAVDYFLEAQHDWDCGGQHACDSCGVPTLLCRVYRARLAGGSPQIGAGRGIR